MEISIIIPIYNAEQFIDKCIVNIINQTYKNYEIILVNDGSKDSSLDIIKGYEKKYDFIKVVNQENQGQGRARNVGLDIATGEYILFVDIDDTMDTKALEILYGIAKKYNSDITICNMAMIDQATEKKYYSPQFSKLKMTSEEAIEAILTDQEVKSYPWGKLYKRTLWKDNSIKFPEKMYYEDMATIIKSFYYSENIVFVNNYLYFYLQNVNSSTKTPNPKNLDDRINALKIIKEFLVEKNIFKNNKKIFTNYCLYHMYILGCQINDWNLSVKMNSFTKEIKLLMEVEKIKFKDVITTKLPKSIKFEVYLMLKSYNCFSKYTLLKKRYRRKK